MDIMHYKDYIPTYYRQGTLIDGNTKRVRKMEKDNTLLHDIVSVMRKNNTPSSSVSDRNEQESHSGTPPERKKHGG